MNASSIKTHLTTLDISELQYILKWIQLYVKYNSEFRLSQIAKYIKTTLQNKYGPHWSCFAGRDFAADLSIVSDKYAHISVNEIEIFIFKN